MNKNQIDFQLIPQNTLDYSIGKMQKALHYDKNLKELFLTIKSFRRL